MKRDEFMEFHANTCQQMMETTRAKNADYSGATEDPFGNFRQIGNLVTVAGVDLNEIGILTRMADKMSRLGSFMTKGEFQVKDESFNDTCIDLANYAIILAAFHMSKKDNK